MRLEPVLQQEGIDRVAARARPAQMRAMPHILDDLEHAVRHDSVHVLAHRDRGNQIVVALQNQRWGLQLLDHRTVVRQECRPRELLGDFRIRATEAVGQLFFAINV